ncbi:Flp pilus assembly protein CpaB [Brevibacillus dissolubilis]|uniref:Flp pilus assembly protein CpaB n=1 Tax=Brevibacillus dissolubilis TaxID=1844116 RepID=UPI0011178065|nr:Flp pilus assembly protein CpaB [Brevibacillus dissolubilis]
MYRFQRAFLVISLLFAALAAFLAYEFLLEIRDDWQDPKVTIPVAAMDVAPLKAIEEKDIAYLTVSKAAIKDLHILTDKSQIIGQYALVPIEKNSPFLKSALIDKEMMTGPFHIPTGYRAITIQSSPLISVGGYVEAGMHVDIHWTYKDQQDQNKTTSLLAFQNIQVLALGSKLENSTESDENPQTITLLMTPADALRLTYMTSTGNMKLSLRPSQIEPNVVLPPVDNTTILQ